MTKPAPKSLSPEAKRIWNNICKEYASLDTYFYTLLKVALEAYTRLQDARELIDKEGVCVKTPTGYQKEHPALKIEKEARSGFLQSMRMLNINIEIPGEVGRPPGT